MLRTVRRDIRLPVKDVTNRCGDTDGNGMPGVSTA